MVLEVMEVEAMEVVAIEVAVEVVVAMEEVAGNSNPMATGTGHMVHKIKQVIQIVLLLMFSLRLSHDHEKRLDLKLKSWTSLSFCHFSSIFLLVLSKIKP